MGRKLLPLVVIGLTAGAPAYAQQAQNAQPQLPDGPGKDIVQSVCSTCHSLNRFIHTGYTPDGWKTVIAMMRNVGAALLWHCIQAFIDHGKSWIVAKLFLILYQKIHYWL